MKKFLLTLIAALTIALAGCGTGGNSTNSNSAADAPKEEQQEQLETTIKLTKDGEESISEKTVEFEEGESLMEVMERNFELTLDDSKEFIVGIDGLESDTAKSYFWTYKVNEEEIMVGAKEYMLKADDVVHFDYAKWE
ncbi:putative small lipoprotein YifL [Bacillus tianshenii]|uniref:Small lipoprotein YifL n=1 Tax=Sutcliffiella tianshenii TaxID=1463404 RepID=A0ABS2P2X1_9BACI|nr:DUF4430 domain-containing protein [Bacillus tianshenii]MBM7621312.1 putative small lipoprotein YifL [Bacillus tianshenii]